MVSNMYIITLWEITLVIGETLFYSLKSATLSDGSTMKKIISGYMFQAKKVFKSTKEHILKVWAIRIFLFKPWISIETGVTYDRVVK